MIRLGVRFVGKVKNMAVFAFLIKYFNNKKTPTYDNKIVIHSYGIRAHFACYTKFGKSKMRVSVLRNGIGKGSICSDSN